MSKQMCFVIQMCSFYLILTRKNADRVDILKFHNKKDEPCFCFVCTPKFFTLKDWGKAEI